MYIHTQNSSSRTLPELVTFLHMPFTSVSDNSLVCEYDIDCYECTIYTLCRALASNHVEDHLLLELTQQHPELLI